MKFTTANVDELCEVHVKYCTGYIHVKVKLAHRLNTLWLPTSRVRTTISFALVVDILYNELYSVLTWLIVLRTRTRSARLFATSTSAAYISSSWTPALHASSRFVTVFFFHFSLHPTTTTTTILYLETAWPATCNGQPGGTLHRVASRRATPSFGANESSTQ